MSSHNSQSISGSNYLQRLQNIRLSDDSANDPLQVSHRRTSSLNGTVDNRMGNKVSNPISNRMPSIDDDFKLYDQNKFITASKLTGPNELLSPKHQATKLISVPRNNTGSPTHSISGLSQQSVYENIDYEVIGRKYDPNSMNRFTHTPQPDENDPSHIYENLGNVSIGK